ncbi:MAG TPA: type II toxin-antitoxin system antitoxin SocA domain-containing protein [Terriglobales bacterium]|nr:type II toxin-antitoxin system antitoxin SocA domain-containing protein [Terriglobales bacterium]
MSVTVQDVANYVLENVGPMTSVKLQKLCFYAQVWTLVATGQVLFPEPIKGWVHGPVIPALRYRMRGGVSANLTAQQIAVLGPVLKKYGGLTARQLSNLTHREQPWIDSRRGLAPTEAGNREITPSAIREFYSRQQF